MTGFESSRSSRSQELVKSTPEAVTGRRLVIGNAVQFAREALKAGFPKLDDQQIPGTTTETAIPPYSPGNSEVHGAKKNVKEAYHTTDGDFALAA